VSAVRITGVSPTQDATLTLQVAPGSVPPPPALTTIVACPLTQSLQSQPPQGGDISHAPGYDCSASSTGRVAGDQTSISWLLPHSFQSTASELDVALVPNPAGQPAPFSVAFSAPGSTSVQASSGAPSPLPPTTAAPGPGDTTPISTSPTPFVPTALPPTGGGTPIPLFAAPVTPPAPLAPAPSPPAVNGVPGQLAAVHLPGDDRAHRLMAVIVLLAMAVAWWYAGGQPARAPRLLGAVGGGAIRPSGAALRVGGIGRFTRPRLGGPRRL
jgi:hypothetical protein